MMMSQKNWNFVNLHSNSNCASYIIPDLYVHLLDKKVVQSRICIVPSPLNL